MAEDMESPKIRMPKTLWSDFADAVAEADPDSDRSKTLRGFIRWYTGQTDRLPQRPERFE